jgi:MYXO-CTERM domain-containing protein
MLVIIALASADDGASNAGGGADCTTPTVTATVPASGQVDVPLDARMVALFDPRCGAPPALTLSLLRQDDDTPVTEARIAGPVPMSLYELFPSAELDPETTYTFRVTPESGGGDTKEIGFTTGDGHVIGLVGAPSVTVSEATWDARVHHVSVELEVTPTADPDRLSLLTLTEASGGLADLAFVPSGETTASFSEQWLASEMPDPVCFRAIQVDGTGASTSGTEDCLHPRGGCGCATGSAGGTAAAAFGALGLVARRRGRSTASVVREHAFGVR